MNNNSYRILKLKSGEELITRITGQKKGKIVIERPMVFKSLTMTDPYGRAKEITTLKNWLSYANHNETSIPKDFIASYLKPDIDVLKLYELEKKKDDGLKNNKIIKDPRGPRNFKNNFKGAEEVEGMMDFFNKYASKDMIDSIMNEMDNMSDEDIEEMRKESFFKESKEEEEEYVNYITMTLFLPPEALISLAEAGLIEEEHIKGLIETLRNSKSNYENDRDAIDRDAEDYGKDWRDWSPYPQDYIDKDYEDPDLA